MKIINVAVKKCTTNDFINSVHRDQKGFNILGFLAFVAVMAVLALLFIPNINLFMGIDKKINAANLEAFNIRSAAIAYEINHDGKYPGDSDALWTDPPSPSDYVGQPRAYYVFDAGTGRITDALTNNSEHIPTNPWTGIKWDYTSGSWVKQ